MDGPHVDRQWERVIVHPSRVCAWFLHARTEHGKSPISLMTIMRPNATRALRGTTQRLPSTGRSAPANAVLSDKDRKLGRFADLVPPFRYNDT
jgi:hypothetical protein